MTKKKVVPGNVPQLKKIDSKAEKFLKKWIFFFQNLSPRIRIILPGDKDFNLENLKKVAISLQKSREVEFEGWPESENVAFIILLDLSYPLHPKKIEPEDCYVFCYKDIAFGLTYFEWDGDGETDPFCKTYSLSNYIDIALSWKYISKLVSDKIKDIENSIKELP